MTVLTAQPIVHAIGVSPIVAHQGGWDEILMVVAPLALIGAMLWLANRRVSAQLEQEELNSGEPQRSGDDGQG